MKPAWKTGDFFQTLFDVIPLLAIIADSEGRVHAVNDPVKSFFGVKSEEVYLEKGGNVFNCIHTKDDPMGCGFAPACRECVVRKAAMTAISGVTVRNEEGIFEFIINGKKMSLNLMVSVAPVSYKGEKLAVVVLVDVTEQRKYQQQLEYLAQTDELTKLVNRRFLIKRLKEKVVEATSYHRPLSVIIFDIDKFKKLNDEYGHSAGDKVLQKVGEIIIKSIRNDDFAGRYGGDEFVIVLPRTTADEAEKVGERIRAVVENKNICYKKSVIRLTISLGVAALGGQSSVDQKVEDLLNKADKALYLAKERGGNIVQLYEVKER